MNFESRKINAARLCVGLGSIGYKAYAAVEDIIDNSVTAGATTIEIRVDIFEGMTLTERGNVERIQILDNGKGMDETSIRKALDIGSDVEYEKNSLSKYGLGLKSAGLSLGDTVSVFSKTESSGYSSCLTLDINVIRDRNDYGVIASTVSDYQKGCLDCFDSGTVVDITNITNTDTANSLKNRLIARLGVIYHEFLKNESEPLEIKLVVRDKETIIKPIDILFRDDSKDNFSEYDYDCKTPFKELVDKEIVIPNSPDNIPPIKVSVSVFPQAKMASYAGFTEQEKEKIGGYNVSYANSGFFIYRNNRLIRWGDNLGIIDRDLRNFRGRIDINTEHDDFLNVDVSKQNLELPEEFIDLLMMACRLPKVTAQKAFNLCKEKINGNDNKEGESASESVLDIVEEDPSTIAEPVDESTKTERRERIIEKSSEDQISNGNEDEVVDEIKVKKILYRDYLTTSNLWSFRLDPEYGTIVYINKSHPFYQLVLKSLPAADAKRQAIECFIYCLAVGEIKTKENLGSVDFNEIDKVMVRFNQVTSWNLTNWTAHNQDLFD